MGATRHEKSFVDFEQPYEQNLIGFKGIVYFGIGLFLLIVITFALMWALLGVMHQEAVEYHGPNDPMMLSDTERLPPEPRLQLAPGFGVDSAQGRINMELIEPQAEWRELEKQWKELWEKGQKDAKTGTISVMPIERAKEIFLQQNANAKSGAQADNVIKSARMTFSDASSGRLAAEKVP